MSGWMTGGECQAVMDEHCILLFPLSAGLGRTVSGYRRLRCGRTMEAVRRSWRPRARVQSHAGIRLKDLTYGRHCNWRAKVKWARGQSKMVDEVKINY